MIQAQIPDDAVFDSDGLLKLLGLRPQALRHARAHGLRYAKRFKRAWYLGKDVKAWLFSPTENGNEDGESSPP